MDTTNLKCGDCLAHCIGTGYYDTEIASVERNQNNVIRNRNRVSQ